MSSKYKTSLFCKEKPDRFYYTHTPTHTKPMFYTLIYWTIVLPRGRSGKNLPANAKDVRNEGLIPGLRRSPGGGNGNPLQYSCLGNPMDRETWQTVVDGAARVGYNLETKPSPPN